MITSKIDDNIYKYFVYNGIRVLLVSNSKFTKSAYAISMGVGSMSDPYDSEGLAHFVEHMLFMGCKKFPNENFFMEHIKKHGGYTNAYTCSEKTVYYATVTSDIHELGTSGIDDMVKCMSNFIEEPLFSSSGVDRELEAVNSEFINALNNNGFRDFELLKQFIKKSNPISQFCIGNIATLKKTNIRELAYNFFKKNYTNDKCCVVLCSEKPIEYLETLIKSSFKISFPHSHCEYPLPTITSPNIFETEFKGRIIQARSITEREVLQINISTTSLKPFYKENAVNFINHLFTTREKGKLLSMLRTQRLAYDVAFESDNFSDFSILCLKISMYDNADIATILQLVYSCIKMLNIYEDEYRRRQAISQVELQYASNKEPIDLAVEIAAEMQEKPWDYTLHSDYIYENYNLELITHIKEALLNYKEWLVIHLSTRPINNPSKDRFFGIEWEVTNILVKDLLHSEQYALDKTLKIVSHHQDIINIYREFKYYTNENIFFVFENIFNSPKGIIIVDLIFPSFIHDNVEIEVFAQAFESFINEKYAKILENYILEFSCSISNISLRLKLEGFNTKLIDVVDLILSSVNTVCQDIEFKEHLDSALAQIKTNFYTVLKGNPFRRSLGFIRDKIYGFPIIEEKIVLLESYINDVNMLINKLNIIFTDNYYNYHFKAIGNINFNDIKNIINNKYTNHSPISNPILAKLQSNTFTFKAFNTQNQLVHKLYLVPADQHPWLELFVAIFSEKFFDELRTKESLGYCVQLFKYELENLLFLCFRVQSNVADINFLQNRIKKFITETKTVLLQMTKQEFENYKVGVINNLLENEINLEMLENTVISAYEHFNNDLHYINKLAEKISTITKEDMMNINIFDLIVFDVTTD